MIALGIGVVLTIAVWAMFRLTTIGLATSAVASNRRAAITLGWSPNLLATFKLGARRAEPDSPAL